MTLKKLLDLHPEYSDLEVVVYRPDSGEYFHVSPENGGVYVSNEDANSVLLVFDAS